MLLHFAWVDMDGVHNLNIFVTDLMMVITSDVVWDWLLKCYLKEDDMLLNYQQKDDVKIVWYVLSEEIADNYEFL